jgi:hypothetical protein
MGHLNSEPRTIDLADCPTGLADFCDQRRSGGAFATARSQGRLPREMDFESRRPFDSMVSFNARDRTRRPAPLARSHGGQNMYETIGRSTVGVATSSRGLLAPSATGRDDEAYLAATLRTTNGGADAKIRSHNSPSAVVEPTAPAAAEAQARSAVAEMIRAIERRLPGRLRRLRVDLENDQFILRGLSSSYYVKQVAGHLAMTAMDAHLLGRLVNEIEVRPAG